MDIEDVKKLLLSSKIVDIDTIHQWTLDKDRCDGLKVMLGDGSILYIEGGSDMGCPFIYVIKE